MLNPGISRRRCLALGLWALPGLGCSARAATDHPPTVLIALLATGHVEANDVGTLRNRLLTGAPEFAERLTFVQREARFVEADLARMVDELAGLGPNVLVCLDLVSAAAAKRRLRDRHIDTPIVFLAHADPVANALVDDLAHPGNNVTGVSTYRCVDAKMLEFLTGAFPARRRIGYLLDGSDTSLDDKACIDQARNNAAHGRVDLITIDVAGPDFLATLKTRAASLRLDAVLAPASAPIWQNRQRVVQTLNELHLPAIYESDIFLAEGGLMSYGPDRTDAFPRLADAVVKILRGSRAGDIPIDRPALFEFVVNLKAPHFQEFGVTAATLQRADRLIE